MPYEELISNIDIKSEELNANEYQEFEEIKEISEMIFDTNTYQDMSNNLIQINDSLSLILTVLYVFLVFIVLKYIYKFFNMFF